jgi:hypothetical protein
LIWLEHGQERIYTTRFQGLDGDHAIAAAKHRIETIAAQPHDDYPEPSGRFAAIPNRN